MNLFVAAIAAETNTFAPIRTGLASFKEHVWFRDDASRHPPVLGSVPLITWRRRGEADGHSVTEGLCTYAQAGGIVARDVYESLREMLIDDIRLAMPIDLVLLFMHGAMVADGYDDCEGDTLSRIRAVVGPSMVVGVELDVHCHLTEQMRTSADAIITFKEYPHIDFNERANELYDLCLSAARGEVKPVMAYYDCRMVNAWRTTFEPMQSFVSEMKRLEGKDRILSVSFAHGFPWGDVPEGGAKMLVVADGDIESAAALAERLGKELWSFREQTVSPHLSVAEAVAAAKAVATGPPLVLADEADNAGGGAPSDNTSILEAFLDDNVDGVVIGAIWDPVAVGFCINAGLGATMTLRVGGKCSSASGDPLDLEITVRAFRSEYVAASLPGQSTPYGDTVWVSCKGIDIVLNSARNQVFSPDFFSGLGIALADKRAIVVKSSQHFYTAFAPLAREIQFVAAPGALRPDFESMVYRKRAGAFWPKDNNPFEAGMSAQG